MANVTETNRKPSADVDDLTASLISADTTLVNTLQAVDADIGQLTAALNANGQDVTSVGNLDASTLEATTSITDASGDTHTGELADSVDVSSIQASSDVDHQQTANRTHDGDDLTPNTVDVATSITDPAGNTFTDLSDPVRVTEEAVTFEESDVAVTTNRCDVSGGSINLTDVYAVSSLIDDFESDNFVIENSNWSDWDATNATVQSQSVIDGSFSAELSVNDGVSTIATDRSSQFEPDSIGASFLIPDNPPSTSGDNLRIEFYEGLNQSTVARARFEDDNSIYLDAGSVDTGVDWQTGVRYDVIFDIDWSSGAYDFVVNGDTVVSAQPLNTNIGIGRIETTLQTSISGGSWSGIVDTFATFDLGPASSGNALIGWESGSPADINSWDLSTFQRTPDGETVTVDVLDDNGNVLFSDIDPNADISTVDTSRNVKLRANFSRNDTSNNPTLDYAARRFTR